MQVTQLHTHHQHAEQWSSHHTIWFWFQPDIRPLWFWLDLKKIESSTSLMSVVYRTQLLWSGVGLMLYHWHRWRYHSHESANLLCFHNGLIWDPALLTVYSAQCRYCQMSNLILLETVSRGPLHFVVSPFDSQKAQYTFNQKVQYTFQVSTCSIHS